MLKFKNPTCEKNKKKSTSFMFLKHLLNLFSNLPPYSCSLSCLIVVVFFLFNFLFLLKYKVEDNETYDVNIDKGNIPRSKLLEQTNCILQHLGFSKFTNNRKFTVVLLKP